MNIELSATYLCIETKADARRMFVAVGAMQNLSKLVVDIDRTSLAVGDIIRKYVPANKIEYQSFLHEDEPILDI